MRSNASHRDAEVRAARGREEAAVDRDALTTASSRPQTAPTSRPGACSQPLDHCGRHLLQCVRGGSLKARHDRIARALALIAPHGTTGLCAHLPVSATADEHKVYKFMCILAPERADPNSANPYTIPLAGPRLMPSSRPTSLSEGEIRPSSA